MYDKYGPGDEPQYKEPHYQDEDDYREKKIMGLQNNTPRTYVSIVDGKITLRAKQDTPGALERTTKEGNKVYELRYDSLSGYLTNIATRDGKFGKEWILSITDGSAVYQLSMHYRGGNARGFLYSLPNVDFNLPIKFTPWSKEVKNEAGEFVKKSALYLSQIKDSQEVQVPWRFTKEDPQGLPELQEVMFQGKTALDDTERMEWLHRLVFDHIIEDVNLANAKRAGGIVTHDEEVEVIPEMEHSVDEPDPDTGLPF